MRVAQGLYERGYITYMRTDNVALSDEALQPRCGRRSPPSTASSSCRRARSSTRRRSKNAQEAHEAIRPTTPLRSPHAVQGELNGQELALYRLIWQRTLASQMADATGTTVSVRLGATSPHDGRPTAEFAAVRHDDHVPRLPRRCTSSRRDEGDDDADGDRREALLPPLAAGDAVPVDVARRRRATPRRRRPATPRRRWSSGSRSWASAGRRRGRRSSRRSRTAATCGRRARRSCRRGPRSPSSACSSSTSTSSSTTTSRRESRRPRRHRRRRAGRRTQWLQRVLLRRRRQLPGLKRLVEENLDEIDAAAINTFPIGARRRRRRDRRQARQVRAVREARRRHRQRARRPARPTS